MQFGAGVIFPRPEADDRAEFRTLLLNTLHDVAEARTVYEAEFEKEARTRAEM